MGKGTPSKGKKGQAKQHYRCRRCGKSTFHKKKSVCSSCGYGKSKKLRSYSWQKKSFFKRLNRATRNKRKK